MIKVTIFKYIHRFWEKKNHSICIEGRENFIVFELAYSKSMNPYPGGILSKENLIALKTFIDNELEIEE